MAHVLRIRPTEIEAPAGDHQVSAMVILDDCAVVLGDFAIGLEMAEFLDRYPVRVQWVESSLLL